MEKYLFIINPIAGKGEAAKLQNLIHERLGRENIEYEILLTKGPKDAIRIATNHNHDVVVAVGGDGTINEVAMGLLESDRGKLGIIPAGTGNDLSKSLNIPLDPERALDTILNGYSKVIQMGKVNDNYFLNISSVGFDADVTSNTNKFKKRIKGRFSYVLGIIYTIIIYKKKNVILQIDDRILNKNLLLLAVGKGNFYGGGMMILPNADLYDDYLYLCLVKDISNIKALTIFPVLFKGKHLKYTKYVETYKAKDVKITCDKSLRLNIDGEVFIGGNDIVFKLSNKKINIISG